MLLKDIFILFLYNRIYFIQKDEKLKTAAAILFLALVFSGCEKEHKNSAEKPVKKELNATKKPKIERFELRDGNKTIGIEFNESGFKLSGTKDVVLLTFFTSWCSSCKAELKELENIAAKYKNIDIVGIQLDENSVRKNFFISNNINTNLKLAKRVYPMLHQPASMPVPLTLLIKNNRYVIHYTGAVPQEMIESDIKKSLGD